MFSGNDMVGNVRENNVFFVDQAILALAVRTLTDQGTQFGGNVGAHVLETLLPRSRALTKRMSRSV